MNRVEGRTALISGGARGIGAATARCLAAGGARVVIGDLLEAEGRRTAESIAAGGSEAAFMRLDVTREADWHACVEFTRSRFGGLDILVNNAGIAVSGSTEELRLEDWRRIQAVNIDGVFLGTKACLPLLRQHACRWPGGSAIVNVSSILGLVGIDGASAYSMTKGAVRLYTKSTALEFARRGYRIRVNSVHPGYIETEMGRGALQRMIDRGLAKDETGARNVLNLMHPIGHMGQPEDVANAIAFLASDDAAFVTGSELVVDGGYTAQ